MQIIPASYEILSDIDGKKELKFIEQVARTCYKSENLISDDTSSAEKLIKNLIARGHEAMLEHSQLSVKFIIDRGVSHEIVRHRLSSYAQESTRYCNYSKAKFNNEITVIMPYYYKENSDRYNIWKLNCEFAENAYFKLLADGSTPQEARAVLPNSLKTEIVMTANYREWRNFFKPRTAKDAHPQMREVTIPLLTELKKELPIIFDDI